jgi:hypothetical protein
MKLVGSWNRDNVSEGSVVVGKVKVGVGGNLSSSWPPVARLGSIAISTCPWQTLIRRCQRFKTSEPPNTVAIPLFSLHCLFGRP